MREILFRGKTLTGRWVEGSYYKQEEFYGSKEDADVIITSKENLTYDQALGFAVVLPETVGQYTGLTDKHGNRIFEGDIIKQEFALNGEERAIVSVIEYGISYAYSDVCGVCQRFSDGSGTAMLSVGDKSGLVYCEIIGNIHDNPELLKGGE